MMARLKWYLDPPSPYQLKEKERKKKHYQSSTPSDKTFLIRACGPRSGPTINNFMRVVDLDPICLKLITSVSSQKLLISIIYSMTQVADLYLISMVKLHTLLSDFIITFNGQFAQTFI